MLLRDDWSRMTHLIYKAFPGASDESSPADVHDANALLLTRLHIFESDTDALLSLRPSGRLSVSLPALQQERKPDRFQAERDFRDQIDADFRDGKIAIVNGWLVEVVNEHTCVGGGPEVGGAHEAHCGTSPIMDLWSAHRERSPRG